MSLLQGIFMKNFYGDGTDRPETYTPSTILIPDSAQLKRLRNEIGARLKEIYQDSGLSQETFAQSLGISKSALNRYIRGKNEPRASAIRLLLENYKVNPTWLITGRGPKYFEGVEEEYLLYSPEGEEGSAFKEVVKKLYELPDLAQILHKLLKTDPSQKDTLEAYLMALEMALKANRKESHGEGEEK